MSIAEIRAEQRVVLPNVSWATYLALIEDVGKHGGGRLTYDRGVLEIMSPSLEHESSKTLIGRAVEAYTEELEIDILSGGSTTFRRDDLLRGIEPDECYYIQNAAEVRNKEQLDLTVDPPPDLAIEVDITRSSLDKLDICSALGIGEVWRFDGRAVEIHILGEDASYSLSQQSRLLPQFPIDELNRLLTKRRTMTETQTIRSFRKTVRKMLEDG